MTQNIQSVEKYYTEIINLIKNNKIQQISHKKIKQSVRKLSALVKQTTNPEQKGMINQLTGKFHLLDTKFQYAIDNYLLKSQFEKDLQEVLFGASEKKQQTQKMPKEVKVPKVETMVQQIVPPVPSNMKLILPEFGVITKKPSQHYRQPTYKQDQLVRKQKLIEQLLGQNMRLREKESKNLDSNTNKSAEINQIEEYIYTNKLLVRENKQINTKLQKLQKVVEALLQQNSQEENKIKVQSRIKTTPNHFETKSSKKNHQFQDLFPIDNLSKREKQKTDVESQFLQYLSERDPLERQRNIDYTIICNSNDLKVISGRKPSFKINDEVVVRPHPITMTPYKSSQYLETPRPLKSRRIQQSITSQPYLNLLKLQSEVMEPDLRQYILPKDKRVSLKEQLQQQSQLQFQKHQSSLRQSVDFRKKSAVSYDNDVSFETFQTVSSRDNSIHDDNMIIESRQNTRIQHTPKLTITKQNLIRNKIAFFKKSLVLFRDEMTIEVGFKKHQLNREMDSIKVTFYLNNKQDNQQVVDISYEYERSSYEVIVQEKAEIIRPNSMSQEEITVYYKGKVPPTFIVVKVQLEDSDFQFVLPVLFFTFKEGLHRLDLSEVKTLTIFPEKQFSSPKFLHSILPLTYVNEHEEVEYRRGQKSYIAECTLVSKKTIQGLRIEWSRNLIKLTCDKGFVDMIAWILADIQP